MFPFHSAIENNKLRRNFSIFNKGQAGKKSFLVCTDRYYVQSDIGLFFVRASRGLDFSKPIDHVILFDFPRDPIEYMRRVGRTARAGRPGHVTVLALGKNVSASPSPQR